MDDEIREQAEELGIAYSSYIQEVLRDHHSTPFDAPNDPVVCVDENVGQEERETGAA